MYKIGDKVIILNNKTNYVDFTWYNDMNNVLGKPDIISESRRLYNITWIDDPSCPHYQGVRVGQKHKIIEIDDYGESFYVDKAGFFYIDNHYNSTCKYKLVTREYKLKRILNEVETKVLNV